MVDRGELLDECIEPRLGGPLIAKPIRGVQRKPWRAPFVSLLPCTFVLVRQDFAEDHEDPTGELLNVLSDDAGMEGFAANFVGLAPDPAHMLVDDLIGPLNQVFATAALLHGVADPFGLCRAAVLLGPLEPLAEAATSGRRHRFTRVPDTAVRTA
jgi:hypothetical protein